MKKALIVANLAGFSGFLISDMEILKSMGYEVYFAANTKMLPWEKMRRVLDEMKVSIIDICFDTKKATSFNNIKAYFQIKKILQKKNFDLIHCHTPIVGMLTRLASRKYRKKGTKVIYTTHGFTFNKYSSKKSNFIYYSIEKLCSKYCDAIITINKEDYNKALYMRCENIYYINGVGFDSKKFSNCIIDRKEYRKRINIDNNKIMILSVGELSDRKNHQIIVKAINNLKNKEEYVYVICGNGINGGTGEKIKKLANEMKVDVRLLGFRSDIPEITKCSDIGAIPSIREGLGLAGVQSLAAGIPIIGSDTQGIKDYIIDGETGYLCNPYDDVQIAKSIEILSDKKNREYMKDKCIEISKNFDIRVSEIQRKKIYEEILDSRRKK